MDATTTNGRKSPAAEFGIQMPEVSKHSPSASLESVTMCGPLVQACNGRDRATAAAKAVGCRRWDAASAAVRAATVASSVVALCVMLSAEQRGSLVVFGLQLPLYSKWSFSGALEYLVGVSAAVAAHSLLQLLSSARRLLKKTPGEPSRNQSWIIFAGDQAFAYAMMSASSAAAGVIDLNRVGVRHAPFPNFCKPLYRFCDRMAISIIFAFLSCVLLAASCLLDVLRLSIY